MKDGRRLVASSGSSEPTLRCRAGPRDAPFYVTKPLHLASNSKGPRIIVLMRPLSGVLLSIAIASGTNPAAVCDAVCGAQATESTAIVTHHAAGATIHAHHHPVANAAGIARSVKAPCTPVASANDCRGLDRAAALQEASKLRVMQHVADAAQSALPVRPLATASFRSDLHDTGPPRPNSPSRISLRI